MQRFKSIILPMQGHNKKELHWLYNTEYVAAPEIGGTDFAENEKVFSYRSLRFWFEGTGIRNTGNLILYVEIPPVKTDIAPDESVL